MMTCHGCHLPNVLTAKKATAEYSRSEVESLYYNCAVITETDLLNNHYYYSHTDIHHSII